MPLVRVDLPEGETDAYHRRLGQCIQQAMHDVLEVPMAECFQTITAHPPGALKLDPDYLGIPRSGEAITVQVFLNSGHDARTKERFYGALAEGLHEGVGLRVEDLVINIVEVQPEDWSFGNGQAQLLEHKESPQ